MKSYSIFSLLFLVFLISCGGDSSKESDVSVPRTSERPVMRDIFTGTESDKRLVDRLDEYYVSCERPMECPGYMAMLAVEMKQDLGYKVGRCSSFLIGPDVLATNAHCISDDLKVGDSCVDRLFILFPESKDKAPERVGCEKILSVFRDQSAGYDYAFIKLAKKMDREVVEIDQGIRPDGMGATIWKVDPYDDTYGLVRNSRCELFADSFYFNYFFTGFSPSFNFSGCQNIPGNSGSPILNGEGKAIGINWGVTENYKESWIFYKNLVPDRHLEFLNFATNFGCLCKKGEAYTHQCENLPASCSEIMVESKKKTFEDSLLRKAAKKFLPEEDFLFLESTVNHSGDFPVKFDFGYWYYIEYLGNSSNKVDIMIFAGPVPKCIGSQEGLELLGKYLGQHEGSSVYSSEVFGISLCELEVNFNSRLQISGMRLDRAKCFGVSGNLMWKKLGEGSGSVGSGRFQYKWGFEGKEGKISPSYLRGFDGITSCDSTLVGR